MQNRIKIFSGNTSRALARETSALLSIEPGEAAVAPFNDGEVNVELLDDVRGADVFIVNSTHPPAENFIEMALLAEAAHDSSASRITLVPVYLGYNRQDRKDKPRTPISAYVMIDFLARRLANRVLLFDIHSEPTAAYFKPLVVDHLFASFTSIPYLRTRLPEPFVVASPDKGGGPRAKQYAQLLGQADFVMFSKTRSGAGEVIQESVKVMGDVSGKNVLFVDDMIDTGGTIIADAEAAKEAGAREIFVFATHALFSRGAVARLDQSHITEVVVTNTIHHDPEELKTQRVKITTLSIAELLGKAINRIHNNESLSTLIL